MMAELFHNRSSPGILVLLGIMKLKSLFGMEESFGSRAARLEPFEM